MERACHLAKLGLLQELLGRLRHDVSWNHRDVSGRSLGGEEGLLVARPASRSRRRIKCRPDGSPLGLLGAHDLADSLTTSAASRLYHSY
jgi:hypothetical protein